MIKLSKTTYVYETSSGQGSTSLGCYKNVAKCQPGFHEYAYLLVQRNSTRANEKILEDLLQ